mmetsp:Transcript_5562/g.5795  ORF Transcript_5562/g.5795 Transcript_5562/m.5795 type:complete len:88 (-) Transcript_5562:308-571(-)
MFIFFVSEEHLKKHKNTRGKKKNLEHAFSGTKQGSKQTQTKPRRNHLFKVFNTGEDFGFPPFCLLGWGCVVWSHCFFLGLGLILGLT